MAVFGASAWLTARVLVGRLQADPSVRATVLRRYGQFRRWHFYLLLLAHFLLVCFGGWGWLVSDGLAHGLLVVPGIDLVRLSPLVAGLLLTWAGYHPLERALAEAGLTPPAEPFPGLWA